MSDRKVSKKPNVLSLVIFTKRIRETIYMAVVFYLAVFLGTVFASEQQVSSSKPATQTASINVRSTLESITGVKIGSDTNPQKPKVQYAKNTLPEKSSDALRAKPVFATVEQKAISVSNPPLPKTQMYRITNSSESVQRVLHRVIDSNETIDAEAPGSSIMTVQVQETTKEKPEKQIQEQAKSQKLVTNMFFDTPVRQALADISAQTGVIILPDISVQGIVTCELQDVPLERALEIVLSCGSFAFRQMNGYILVGSMNAESPSFSRLSETRRLKMNYVKAEEAVKMLGETVQTYAKANATSNTVSITAPAGLLERIISDLKLIDHPSRHIMLDARIVALERGDLLNLGVQWNWPGISAGTFSNSEHHGGGAPERVDWPWGVQIGYTPGQEFTNALMMTLNLLAENDEATVIASPQVMAQDGQEAEIKVVTEEYFKISQEAYYYTRFELETIETGTTLTITPRIGDNNEITLDIVTEVSDVIARGEDNLPVVTRRTTKNTVRIEDGGTAAVAGLMDTRRRSQKSRAPGLASIPLVGGLFRNKNESESARHVSVFITTRLLSEKKPNSQEYIKGRTQLDPAGEEFRKQLEESMEMMNTNSTIR